MSNVVNYGFIGLRDLFGERVTTVGVEVVQEAIQATVAEYNRAVNTMLTSLAQPTTEHMRRYKLPGAADLQPLDEWGNPLPVRAFAHMDLAWPLQRGGYAWGNNRETRALMTVAEANEQTTHALMADMNWVRRHMLAALLDNVSWTYDDDQYGSLTVKPLANGDTDTYLRIGGAVETDNHYLAQANAIDATHDPFPTIYEELAEHPGNSGTYVVYVASDLKSSIMALPDFLEVRDPVVIPGNASDVLTVTNELDNQIRGFGDMVLGRKDRMYIVEWKSLPRGYMLAVAQGAVDAPLAMRQLPVATLQGYRFEAFSPDGNLQEYRYLRTAGFGALNRVAAAVYYVGDSSYVVPSGYDAPLAA